MAELALRKDDSELTISTGGVDIARYAFAPGGAASEGPKPFWHPLRTLDGAPLTAFRPWDHRWHKGLQMTWTHVSGQNFWGGPTFRSGTGYRQLDNVGRIRHEGFAAPPAVTAADVSFTEGLTWITRAGAAWLAETRTHRLHGVDTERGLWILDFSTRLRNIAGHDLELGSPTTQGRPNAGYTGLVLRMPRAWTGGRVLAGGVDDEAGADAVMGREAPWVAFWGEHDEYDGGGTVLAFAGRSSGIPPIRWFVRSEPFPILAPSPSFDEHILLAPGDELTLMHRHVFGDRVWSVAETRELAAEWAP
ncbi:DUF6807 domain-containing protein [Microbacterium timonense]|uniref:DUF6807 domain-containing protein n=1 Tax=Microbacterium timonense TaxID=2086576 RepID=UPI000D0EE726|nr:PmoA family protein [Microbacterium timonense]